MTAILTLVFNPFTVVFPRCEERSVLYSRAILYETRTSSMQDMYYRLFTIKTFNMYLFTGVFCSMTIHIVIPQKVWNETKKDRKKGRTIVFHIQSRMVNINLWRWFFLERSCFTDTTAD